MATSWSSVSTPSATTVKPERVREVHDRGDDGIGGGIQPDRADEGPVDLHDVDGKRRR